MKNRTQAQLASLTQTRDTRVEQMRSLKAIIALARKLQGTIYRTLKNRRVFEDFPNFVLAKG